MFAGVRTMRRAALLVVLAVALAALGTQAAVSTIHFRANGGGFPNALWHIALFFTVLTNALVALVCATSLVDEGGRLFFARPSTQSATALYITVVGLIYNLILRSLWDPHGLQYVADLLLHSVTPPLYVGCWLLFMRKGDLAWRDVFWWLLYPLGYLIYALLRGAIGGLYPYPFIDLAALGAPVVARNSLLMLALFLGLGFVVLAVDKAIGLRSKKLA